MTALNHRLILLYLIPIQAMFGKFPKPFLLQKYNLSQFNELLTAVKQGNMRGYIDIKQCKERETRIWALVKLALTQLS